MPGNRSFKAEVFRKAPTLAEPHGDRATLTVQSIAGGGCSLLRLKWSGGEVLFALADTSEEKRLARALT